MDDFLERRRIPIIVLLLVVIVTGLVVLYLRWPRTSAVKSSQGIPSIKTSEPRLVTLKVYVTGAVAHPGVYTFRDGERVEDALNAAGGALADADLSQLNLAQRLRDEGYITVPRKGEPPAAGASSAAQAATININTATVSQLDSLPGIGATYAQRIVDYRAANGPFQKISDLVDKKIVPQSTFDKIKDSIDVR